MTVLAILPAAVPSRPENRPRGDFLVVRATDIALIALVQEGIDLTRKLFTEL